MSESKFYGYDVLIFTRGRKYHSTIAENMNLWDSTNRALGFNASPSRFTAVVVPTTVAERLRDPEPGSFQEEMNEIWLEAALAPKTKPVIGSRIAVYVLEFTKPDGTVTYYRRSMDRDDAYEAAKRWEKDGVKVRVIEKRFKVAELVEA